MPQIEVFDPTQGSYTLLGDRYLGSDYHYVTVDLQSYVPQSGGMIVPRYRACPPGHETSFRHDDCLPVGSIELEGRTFPSPNHPEAFLTSMYGYLGQGAKYNPVTGKYVAPEPFPIDQAQAD